MDLTHIFINNLWWAALRSKEYTCTAPKYKHVSYTNCHYDRISAGAASFPDATMPVLIYQTKCEKNKKEMMIMLL